MRFHGTSFPYEFHISAECRDKYGFDDALFAFSGNAIFANFHAARVFADRMNGRRDLVLHPERAVRAGQINAMGLIDEILHFMVRLYRERVDAAALSGASDRLDAALGRETVDKALAFFADRFPTVSVYRKRLSAAEWLAGRTGDTENRLIALEEMLLLWLANVNPAFSPYSELFDDAGLQEKTAYAEIISGLDGYFKTRLPFGPYGQNLVDLLRSPAVAAPHSLPGQLEYIRLHWGNLLGEYLVRLLGGLDFLQEEEKAAIFGLGGGPGPGPSSAPDFSQLNLEAERYSPDRDWMPRLVLIAKNAYVWLDQLSKTAGTALTRLDQIPDSELDRLAAAGFTGLWLIGLWERSRASRRIKQLCGNPEALASAYSLFDYRIADDLGGEAAFRDLKDRAMRRGIRMASDLVPNHMSIDSIWMTEHPERFVSLDYSPFPSYSFDGPDLSEDGRTGIFLEDHYYSRSDAAVVFKRVDRQTGSVRYVYHGNDGTSMPWNDTAQLDYLRPDVREAMIGTILQVARMFPIIRFDAAMTLAKKHFHRLWFPEPGTGGAIPSRSDFGMTRAQFDAAMPEEFWRQVVDRVAAEAPDTLLLAEAFWLMEGYFVRTLGMHRVYNSAFMNMLRDEDNAKYRAAIRSTLEFDPEILKRYVNFMNNPDERTAVEQFGNGDKYFGICTLMCTLPGLPMFGHGQIEGFSEKYGMEYRKAYWDETPDEALMARHGREIFPLLHRRRLFAGVEHFLLYDCAGDDGSVRENVFAYTNRSGEDRALVLVHNKYDHASGWIRESCPVSSASADGKRLVRRTLADGLGLSDRPEQYCVYRDAVGGLEYIRGCADVHRRGWRVDLHAYERRVYLDFREVTDGPGAPWAELCRLLDGRGVPDIHSEMRVFFIRPVTESLEAILNADTFRSILDGRGGPKDPAWMDGLSGRTAAFLALWAEKTGGGGAETAAAETMKRVRAVIKCIAGGNRPVSGPAGPRMKPAGNAAVRKRVQAFLDADPRRPALLFAWAVLHRLGEVTDSGRWPEAGRLALDEWRFGEVVSRMLQGLGESGEDAWKSVTELRMLIRLSDWAGLSLIHI
ncbi:MAG: alpha-amylase family glycosyl hydrolase [bacterium]|nr:alpha-amylase family glycosyl hydrolase [bacterium]